MDFPSLKAQKFLRVLLREPLNYEVTRQNGSHRKLESRNGYPDLLFSFHDGVTIPGGAVKKILVKDVGLDEDSARKLV
ncbi:MAG: type II toxin-antitoxin system HicA family toxin [Rubrobacteraceae bacterium]|nr:type II toxin-antitoxin system HicA family toxin [Rubrobacter sp.]